jgi:hypothetical protein
MEGNTFQHESHSNRGLNFYKQSYRHEDRQDYVQRHKQKVHNNTFTTTVGITEEVSFHRKKLLPSSEPKKYSISLVNTYRYSPSLRAAKRYLWRIRSPRSMFHVLSRQKRAGHMEAQTIAHHKRWFCQSLKKANLEVVRN